MSWINVAVGGMTALNQVQAGRFANAKSKLQAEAEDYQATIELDNARKMADVIRRSGRQTLGAVTAGYAGAGVKVGEGSAGEAERYVEQGVEHDAFQAILEGQRRATGLQTDASMQRAQGGMQQTAGYTTAAGTILSSAYQGWRASGWKTLQPNNDGDGLSQGDRRKLGVF